MPYVSGGHVNQKKGGYALVFGQWDSIALFQLMYHNVSADAFLERKYNKFQDAFKVLDIAAVV